MRPPCGSGHPACRWWHTGSPSASERASDGDTKLGPQAATGGGHTRLTSASRWARSSREGRQGWRRQLGTGPHSPPPALPRPPPPRLPARGPQACPGSSGLEGNSAGTRTFFINLLDGLQLLGGPGGDDLRQHLLVRAGALSGHAGVTGEKRVNEAKRKVVFPEQTLPQLQNYIEYPT